MKSLQELELTGGFSDTYLNYLYRKAILSQKRKIDSYKRLTIVKKNETDEKIQEARIFEAWKYRKLEEKAEQKRYCRGQLSVRERLRLAQTLEDINQGLYEDL